MNWEKYTVGTNDAFYFIMGFSFFVIFKLFCLLSETKYTHLTWQLAKRCLSVWEERKCHRVWHSREMFLDFCFQHSTNWLAYSGRHSFSFGPAYHLRGLATFFFNKGCDATAYSKRNSHTIDICSINPANEGRVVFLPFLTLTSCFFLLDTRSTEPTVQVLCYCFFFPLERRSGATV